MRYDNCILPRRMIATSEFSEKNLDIIAINDWFLYSRYCSGKVIPSTLIHCFIKSILHSMPSLNDGINKNITKY